MSEPVFLYLVTAVMVVADAVVVLSHVGAL